MKPGWKFKYVPLSSPNLSPYTAWMHVHHEANIHEVIERMIEFLSLSGFSRETIEAGLGEYAIEAPRRGK